MKQSIFALITLPLVTLGLTACRRVTFTETLPLVEERVAHKGDKLNFPAPSASGKDKDTLFYLHFTAAKSPCVNDLKPAKAGKHFQCIVSEEPPYATKYWFYIDNNPPKPKGKGEKANYRVGKCPPSLCSGVIVIVPTSGSGSGSKEGPAPYGMLATDSGPTMAVTIYYEDNGTPKADPASVNQGQLLTWQTDGGSAWSVDFGDRSPCEKTFTFNSDKEKRFCKVKSDVAGLYSYTIDGKPDVFALDVDASLSPHSGVQ